MTHDGIAAAQEAAGVGSYTVGQQHGVAALDEQSLRSPVVYEKDKEYVVERGRCGGWKHHRRRIPAGKMTGLQWSDGLHQAVKPKSASRLKPRRRRLAYQRS